MINHAGDNLQTPGLLAFWDISDATAQPVARIGGTKLWRPPSSEDWVWSQGYIANCAELVNQLGLQGMPDDSELLYILFRRFGVEAPKFITGTFAWILWDSQSQALLVARDRIGNHNFYYTTLNGTFWVASQLEILLELEEIPHKPNPRSIVAHMTGCAPLASETFYSSIHEIEPGGWLRLQAGNLRMGHYWRVQPQPLLKLSSDAEYAQALRELLFRVITEHAPTGEAGITLSSGLDSTSIAAVIRHCAPQTRLTALCWASPEVPVADESQFSAEVCSFLDIPSIQLRADIYWPMSGSDGIRTFAATPFTGYYPEIFDETLITASQKGIGVVFTGMSGDHLFGGNVFAYPDLLLTGRWLELARQIRYHLPRSTMGLSLYQIIRGMILSPIRGAYLPGWRIDASPPAPWLRPPYDELYRENFGHPPQVRFMLPGRLGRLRLLSHPTLPYYAAVMNRQAASHGIEFRYPLLDHRLIEFAASLPSEQTFRASQRKIIVRNAMRGLLPSSVLEMWDKILPTEIFHRGLREREQAKAWHLLTNMRAAEMGFVHEPTVRQAYQDYLSGKTDNTLFWHTLTLEDWLRRWF